MGASVPQAEGQDGRRVQNAGIDPPGYSGVRPGPHFFPQGIRPVTTKERVRDLLERLPDDCSLDDVLYHLYVVQSIDRGVADADAGRTISHEQVAQELRRKWVLGAAE